MNQNLIFFPCFAMLILTTLVLLRMFVLRVKAVKNGSLDIRYFKTYDMQIPKPHLMEQASRNFTNLFEVPTLFYMVSAFALMTHNVDSLIYRAAWAYVILRFIHSFIHLTNNNIRARMGVYALSWLVLLFVSGVLAFRIFKAG